jgi:hypothetical protein
MTKRESTKSEARSSKQIQNGEKQTTTMLQTGRIELTVLDFLILSSFWPGLFRISCFEFRIYPCGVSFGFRYSDFGFFRRVLGAINCLKGKNPYDG